jgi:cytochrome c553
MRALSASELLDVWEQGQGERPAQRALVLLAAACDQSIDALARLPVGERDARLLQLRQSAFGSRITSVATCAECGERLELSFDASDLSVAGEQPEAELSLDIDGYQIRFRLPNSLDLMAAANLKGMGAARTLLLEQCIRSAGRRGDEISTTQLPESVVEQISARMNEADPQADIQLALKCPVCSNEWHAAFDIESFFWTEIDAWAARILGEVHMLASAYGWSEQDILRLSAWRRECYLNLVNG